MLADVERSPLDEAVAELAAWGHYVRGVETDISTPADLSDVDLAGQHEIVA